MRAKLTSKLPAANPVAWSTRMLKERGFGVTPVPPGAEVVAAGAAGLMLCVGNFQPGDAVVGQGAEAAVEEAFAATASAEGGAGGAFGGAADACDALVAEHGLSASGISWSRGSPAEALGSLESGIEVLPLDWARKQAWRVGVLNTHL
jgi:hypothetical protein